MPTLLLIGITNVIGIQIMVPMGKEKHVLFSEIAGALVDLAINAALIPDYGAAGAAIGTLVAETVVLIWQYFSLKDVAGTMLKSVKYWLILIALTASTAASLWVKLLKFNDILAILVSAVLFFGIYLLVMIIFKEPLVHETFIQIKINSKRRITKMKYDYLIVGAGLFGAVFAYEATKKGKKCLVIDKRDHIAGNIYTKETENINVHQYGAHIFHTSDRKIWDYVNSFADFNNYINSPVAVYKDELYNLPFNMNTFSKMWNIKTPSEAKAIIEKQIEELNITEPQNLEEQALSLVGTDVYEKLIKGYTEKQWGRNCKELPAFIIKRLPLRFTYDNNYFNDRYQGIPIGGYTKIVEKMLEGSDVLLDTDYFEFIKDNEGIADKVLFTGMIDEYYDFCYGHLEYRTVRFETEVLDCDNYQGNAVVNYTDREVPYTRIIEHKHFEFGKQEKTIISREYSTEWEPGMEPYYPVNNERNNDLFEKYKALADKEEKVIFGGRLVIINITIWTR